MIVDVPAGVTPRADIDLSDLTASVRAGDARWVGESTLEIPFDSEPTPAEQRRIRRRLLTSDAAQEQMVAELLSAGNAMPDGPVAKVLRLLIRERLGPLYEDAP